MGNEIIETIKYRGYDINIYSDESAQDPRGDSNLGKMICFHSRYNLGDKHDFTSPEDFQNSLKGNEVILPLYLYDNSGITMNTGGFSCQWDSGQVGWIYADIEMMQEIGHDWKKWTPKRKEQVLEWLKSDVETYDKFIKGEGYGYKIEGLDDDDSCWGFLGYDHKKSGLLDYAQDAIDGEIKYKTQSQIQKLKNYIKNKVSLIYRKPSLL